MAMTPQEHATGEEIVRHLCIGRTIDRIHISPPPILRLAAPAALSLELSAKDDIFFTIEGSWHFYPQRPDRWTEDTDGQATPPFEAVKQLVASIREHVIIDAQLGEQSPHLIITFEGGACLFVNGYNNSYESWTLVGNDYRIIALPESSIAYWTPQGTR